MDLKAIESLLKLLSEHDVSRFQYSDDNVNMQLDLGPQYVAAAQVAVAAPAAAPVAAPAPVAANAPAAPVADADDGLIIVESPMVGTFYRSASPGAQPFVEVGARVQPGSVLCIVEAMKLMNEIEAEVAGEIVQICVENAQPIQFGQPLFKIRPS
jgi:acetyl-CoA carboxylase biotin carboxyl carrier protein